MARINGEADRGEELNPIAIKKNIDGYGALDTSQTFVLKPQCPRWSHEQGGKMSELARQAKEIAKALGFVVYS